MSDTLRIAIEVVAGVIPETKIETYTKRFLISSDIWYAQNDYEGKRKECIMKY